jgi:hypothetical protein
LCKSKTMMLVLVSIDFWMELASKPSKMEIVLGDGGWGEGKSCWLHLMTSGLSRVENACQTHFSKNRTFVRVLFLKQEPIYLKQDLK